MVVAACVSKAPCRAGFSLVAACLCCLFLSVPSFAQQKGAEPATAPVPGGETGSGDKNNAINERAKQMGTRPAEPPAEP